MACSNRMEVLWLSHRPIIRTGNMAEPLIFSIEQYGSRSENMKSLDAKELILSQRRI